MQQTAAQTARPDPQFLPSPKLPDRSGTRGDTSARALRRGYRTVTLYMTALSRIRAYGLCLSY